MKPYPSLTVLGQARRLRALAMQALTRYDLDVACLRLVTNDLNGIFRLDTRDGQKYILRVTLPEGGHTLDHITAEMDWLSAIASDTHLNVSHPVPARDRSLVVEAATPGVPEPRYCAVFTWMPGKTLAKDPSAANIANMGELMACLHAHALSYRPRAGLSLLSFDRVFPFPEPVVLFEDEHAALFNDDRRAIYQKAIAWAQDSIDQLKSSGEPMRLIHGDLHQYNVLNTRGRLSPIDFEDLMLGWPIQDIGITLYYIKSFNPETYPALIAAFQEGYTRHSPWPERHPGEIDSFIAARGLGLANFVLNDPNPAWKSKAAEFIERIEKRLRGLMPGNV